MIQTEQITKTLIKHINVLLSLPKVENKKVFDFLELITSTRIDFLLSKPSNELKKFVNDDVFGELLLTVYMELSLHGINLELITSTMYTLTTETYRNDVWYSGDVLVSLPELQETPQAIVMLLIKLNQIEIFNHVEIQQFT